MRIVALRSLAWCLVEPDPRNALVFMCCGLGKGSVIVDDKALDWHEAISDIVRTLGISKPFAEQLVSLPDITPPRIHFASVLADNLENKDLLRIHFFVNILQIKP